MSPPVMGQNSEEILSELGYSDAEIGELVRLGVAVVGLEPATS
jgi:crotonobetainyl-CoA:carnitine CoA-transferase CaiB-like acyl-CoA transferase